MKKTIFIFGLLLSSLFAFSQNDTTVIRGIVHSGNIKKVKIECLVNPIIVRYQTYFAPVNERSEFVLKIPLTQISSGLITAGNFYHDICLLPADNFFIDLDADTIKYSGKGADKNNFLYFLEKSNYSNWIFYNSSNEGKILPNDFALKMKEFRDKRIELLNNYSLKHKIEPEFKALFLADNQVIYRGIMTKYPQQFSYINNIKEDSIKLTPEYYNLRQFDYIINDNFIMSFKYVFDLEQFLYSKEQDMGEIKIDTTNKKHSFDLFQDPWTIKERILLIDSLKGKTQEYVMACRLCRKLSQGGLLDTILYNEFIKRAKDQVTIDAVTQSLIKFNQKRSLKGKPLNEEFIHTQLNDTIGNVLSFGELINQFKGKVIYLDIWGLSCAPCRGAMPSSKKLRDKLSGKPIEFVFLTIEEMNKKRWDEAFKVSLTKDNHYLLSDGLNSRFLEFMKINWVPCYMIIDKEGKLIEYNANDPSDDISLEKQLTELAGKN